MSASVTGTTAGEPGKSPERPVRLLTASVHEIALRFSDMDSLGHLSNLRYLEFAEDARHAWAREIERTDTLVSEGLPELREAVSMEIEFLLPVPRDCPMIRTGSSLDDDLLYQELTSSDGGQERLHATVRTILGARKALVPTADMPHRTSTELRHEEIIRGTLTLRTMLDLLQQSRLDMLPHVELPEGHHYVVAQLSVRFGSHGTSRNVCDTYAVIRRVGSSSLTVESELRRGGGVDVHGTAVVVAYDIDRQQSRPLTACEKSYISRFASRLS